MKYETKEITYYSGFSYEICFAKTIVLTENNSDCYSFLLLKNTCICIETEKSAEKQVLSGNGLLVLSPNHGISKITLLDGAEDSVQTLIFSPKGINSNFESFPETFEYQALNSLKEGFAFTRLNHEIYETFVNNFERINEQLNIVQGQFWPCLGKSYVLELIILLARNDFINSKENTIENKMEQVIDYFKYAYSKKFSLDELAQKFGTNRTTLNAMFNKKYELTAMEYLNKIRMENASMMLSNTGLPISMIAERTGFSDEAYFSRAFKKSKGMSPSDFRKSISHPYGLQWQSWNLS